MSLGPIEQVRVGPRWFEIRKPSRPFDVLVDETLDHPDGVFPWWAMLWPSAVALGEELLERAPIRGRALELGCGLGLAGIVATAAGLTVDATDIEAEALMLTRDSAALNHIELADVRYLDWKRPGDQRRYDLVLGADILFDEAFHPALLALLPHLLEAGATVILSDPGRSEARDFLATLPGHFTVTATQRQIRLHETDTRVDLYTLTPA